MKHLLQSLAILTTILLFCIPELYAQKENEVSSEKAVEYLQKGEWKNAVEAFEVVTEKHPENGVAWLQMGFALHAMEEYDRAIEAYTEAVELGSPVSVLAMFNIGCSYALKGEKEQAFSWLEKAADAGFNRRETVREDEDLQSLRDSKRFDMIVEKIDRNARPCAYVDGAGELDFWIGEWEVYNPSGQLAGKSSIQTILDDCVISENWSGTFGMNGKSFNTYDPTIGKWRQTWVDDKGSTLIFVGEVVDGAMVFERESTDAEGVKTLSQMIIAPLENGHVSQKGQSSTDGGDTWNVNWQLTYIPRELPDEESGS